MFKETEAVRPHTFDPHAKGGAIARNAMAGDWLALYKNAACRIDPSLALRETG